MPSWAPALTAFAEAAAPVNVTWMLVGSAATAVHGVAGVIPGDVDVLVHPDTGDAALEEVAARLIRLAPARQADSGTDLATFISTAEQPLIHGGPWTFGRWHVEGTKLEVARIREHLGDGPLKTHGHPVWELRRPIAWRGLQIPAVPLEIQWATMTLRGQAERLDAVINTPGLLWDTALARAALIARGLDPDQHPHRPDRRTDIPRSARSRRVSR